MGVSPVPVTVSPVDRRRLKWLCRPSAQCRQRERASIILAAESGASNTVVAAQVGVSRETVRKWRGRYADKGVAGLADYPRSGRPARFTPAQTVQVKAIACTSPEKDKHLPLARWSVAEIARQAVRNTRSKPCRGARSRGGSAKTP